MTTNRAVVSWLSVLGYQLSAAAATAAVTNAAAAVTSTSSNDATPGAALLHGELHRLQLLANPAAALEPCARPVESVLGVVLALGINCVNQLRATAGSDTGGDGDGDGDGYDNGDSRRPSSSALETTTAATNTTTTTATSTTSTAIDAAEHGPAFANRLTATAVRDRVHWVVRQLLSADARLLAQRRAIEALRSESEGCNLHAAALERQVR
jgi:hypothetical protein